ncbi:helix-turn-helix transcriptional regulator [Cytobacillus oceanisediminis]|nr:helix-turn-helix transcriptional regulator [Cytobacillus oceanisediminis]
MKNRLAELRKTNGITQEELARKIGVTRNYISRIENGASNGSISVLYNIAKVLGVKISDIFLD